MIFTFFLWLVLVNRLIRDGLVDSKIGGPVNPNLNC